MMGVRWKLFFGGYHLQNGCIRRYLGCPSASADNNLLITIYKLSAYYTASQIDVDTHVFDWKWLNHGHNHTVLAIISVHNLIIDH